MTKTINRLARKDNLGKYMKLLIIVKELLFIFLFYISECLLLKFSYLQSTSKIKISFRNHVDMALLKTSWCLQFVFKP